MEKIINGKFYSTETAKAMGSYDNGLGIRDFNALEETLYRKKTGEFFLYGKGGANTQYAESMGNGRTSGEDIIPLTEEGAREWAEAHLTVKEYIAIFGKPEE